MKNSAPTGILLVSTGTPDSTAVPDVHRYLNQFLMDRHILSMPWLLRRLLVSLVILPFRPRKSAAAYQKIWLPEGSPLSVYSHKLKEQLQSRQAAPVALAMRYGSPSIFQGLQQLQKQTGEILVLPLFPHYAWSTWESIRQECLQTARRHWPQLRLRFLPPFYQHPLFIDTLSARLQASDLGQYDHVLFSYHSIPLSHLRLADPSGHCLSEHCCQSRASAWETCYKYQTSQTTRLLVEKLQLAADRYSVAYQSRFLSEAWLSPFTDLKLEELARQGVKKLLVVTPGFVTDNLETLEELGEREKHRFLAAGGERLDLLPCLNDGTDWAMALAQITGEFLAGQRQQK